MRPSSTFGLVMAVMTAFSGVFISPAPISKETISGKATDPAFIVRVVGRGVPENNHPKKLANPDDPAAGGLDLWIGATVAYEDIKEEIKKEKEEDQKKTTVPFMLKFSDDTNKQDQARQIAISTRNESRTLAVIGHSITATTRVAVPIYAQAGIPVIVPLATGRAAMTGEDPMQAANLAARRLPNTFRLPASDDNIQAPATAYLVSALKPPPAKVYILTGMKEDAKEYAEPLCTLITEMVSAKNSDLPISSSTLDSTDSMDTVVTNIHKDYTSADVVVFCGYSHEAATLLAHLASVYKTDETTNSTANSHEEDNKASPKPSRPRLVFVEPQPGIEKTNTDFTIYRTGPIDPTWGCNENNSAINRLKNAAHNAGRPLTIEQVHGYDAVKVVWSAAQRCLELGAESSDNGLSRRCLLDELNSERIYHGICGDYSFQDGENSIADYFYFAFASPNATFPDSPIPDAGPGENMPKGERVCAAHVVSSSTVNAAPSPIQSRSDCDIYFYHLPPQEVLHMLTLEKSGGALRK
jgi:ABC-type branched-subunit amino acid transport system substrate-binding protein